MRATQFSGEDRLDVIKSERPSMLSLYRPFNCGTSWNLNIHRSLNVNDVFQANLFDKHCTNILAIRNHASWIRTSTWINLRCAFCTWVFSYSANLKCLIILGLDCQFSRKTIFLHLAPGKLRILNARRRRAFMKYRFGSTPGWTCWSVSMYYQNVRWFLNIVKLCFWKNEMKMGATKFYVFKYSE